MKTLACALSLLTVLLLTCLPVMGSDAPSGAPPGPGADAPVQEAAPDGSLRSRTYGTTAQIAHTIGGYAFDPFTSAQTFSGVVGTGDRFLTNGGTFLAPVNLPAGARVTGIEIQGCDTSAAGEVQARLFSNTIAGGVESEINHGGVTTGDLATGGCGFYFVNLPAPVVVDNFNRTYYVDLITDTIDGTNRFSAVRLYYFLQVSAPPPGATFDDVPVGHPFRPFIEALVASGLTGGCTPSLFCPDDPVTRKQIAAFLARALGLHFAP